MQKDTASVFRIAMRLEGFERALVVRGHQARIARHIVEYDPYPSGGSTSF
jgi:hypothetical protein